MSPNDFLQTRYINTFLHVFQKVLVVYYRKTCGSQNLVASFSFWKCVFRKNNMIDFLQKAYNKEYLCMSQFGSSILSLGSACIEKAAITIFFKRHI